MIITAPYTGCGSTQVPPVWADWINRHSTPIEREGPKFLDAVDKALGYMQRPRNPNSNDPRYTGMGLRPQQIFTPAGMEKLEALLEIHGQMFSNLHYDKNEKALTPNQAAHMSGLSAEAYNRGVRAMHAQGRLGQYKR